LAVVVLKKDESATPKELIEFLEPHFAKWWLPDAIEFASEIPRTSAASLSSLSAQQLVIASNSIRSPVAKSFTDGVNSVRGRPLRAWQQQPTIFGGNENGDDGRANKGIRSWPSA
jgi:hypothetical protein